MHVKTTPVTSLLAMVVVFALVLSFAPTTDAGEFVITAHVLTYTSEGGDQLSVDTSYAEVPEDDDDEYLLARLSGVHELRLGQFTVAPDAKGHLLWNGEPEPPADNPFKRISSPRITVGEGQEAAVRSDSAVEFLERQAEGSYQLRTTPPEASPGLRMDFAISTPDEAQPDQVTMDFKVLLSVMTGRQPLQETDLDMGKPILEEHPSEATLKVKLGEWLIPSWFVTNEEPSGEKEFLLVLLRIERAPGQ